MVVATVVMIDAHLVYAVPDADRTLGGSRDIALSALSQLVRQLLSKTPILLSTTSRRFCAQRSRLQPGHPTVP
jgi:hypothetical protein